MGFKGLMLNLKVVIADHPANAVTPFFAPILPRFLLSFAAGLVNKVSHR